MNNKKSLYLLPLLMLVLACKVFASPTQIDTSPTQNTEPPSQSNESISTLPPPTTIASESDDPCNSDQWHILITNTIQYPLGDGWKFVIAELALENASVFWGKIDFSNVTVTTEDGFVYEPISGFLKFPAEPATRYSGEHFTSDLGSNSLFIYQKIPPGFIVRGDDRGYYKNEQILNYIFKVAENQQQFTIHGKKYVSCISNGESVYPSSASEIALPLNEVANPKYQIIDGKDNEIMPILNNPIELSGAGTFQVYKIERSHPQYYEDINAIYQYFTLTNGSQGYEVTDYINGYIIGDDGIVRTFGCPQSACDTADGQNGNGWFRVGPAQTTEGIYGIPVPLNVNNLIFILEWKDSLQLFKLQ